MVPHLKTLKGMAVYLKTLRDIALLIASACFPGNQVKNQRSSKKHNAGTAPFVVASFSSRRLIAEKGLWRSKQIARGLIISIR
jgi:hypothetical protein